MRVDQDPVVLVAVSDIHLSHTPPRLRSQEPDWYGAMKRQFDQLRDLVITCNGTLGTNPKVVYPGDIFDRWNPPPELINFALDNMVPGYAIPGQHDLPHHCYDDIKRSGYWTLVRAGLLTDLPPGVPTGAGTIVLHGFPWGYPLTACREPHSFCLDVAVIHAYCWRKGCSYPDAPQDRSANEHTRNLKNYHLRLFGDNHMGFTQDGLVNCGTFMRRRQDELDYHPAATLVRQSGKVERRRWDLSQDVYDIAEHTTPDDPIHTFDALLGQLQGMGRGVADFRSTLIEQLRVRGVVDEVRDAVMEALGE